MGFFSFFFSLLVEATLASEVLSIILKETCFKCNQVLLVFGYSMKEIVCKALRMSIQRNTVKLGGNSRVHNLRNDKCI